MRAVSVLMREWAELVSDGVLSEEGEEWITSLSYPFEEWYRIHYQGYSRSRREGLLARDNASEIVVGMLRRWGVVLRIQAKIWPTNSIMVRLLAHAGLRPMRAQALCDTQGMKKSNNIKIVKSITCKGAQEHVCTSLPHPTSPLIIYNLSVLVLT